MGRVRERWSTLSLFVTLHYSHIPIYIYKTFLLPSFLAVWVFFASLLENVMFWRNHYRGVPLMCLLFLANVLCDSSIDGERIIREIFFIWCIIWASCMLNLWFFFAKKTEIMKTFLNCFFIHFMMWCDIFFADSRYVALKTLYIENIDCISEIWCINSFNNF